MSDDTFQFICVTGLEFHNYAIYEDWVNLGVFSDASFIREKFLVICLHRGLNPGFPRGRQERLFTPFQYIPRKVKFYFYSCKKKLLDAFFL